MAKERAKKKLKVNPDEADIARLIYAWYLSNMGAKSIAERLNEEGYEYRGKPWSKNRILDIIGDEAYVGRYYFNKRNGKTNQLKPKEEWILIPIEPIIDEVTWERARTLKQKRSPTKSGREATAFGFKTLLTGIAKCGLCGGSMALETAKGGKYTYYNCSNFIRRGKSSCAGQRIPAHNLEQAVIDHMANKLFTKDRIKTILKGIYHEIKEIDKRNESQRKSLSRKLDDISNRLNNQYEAIETGVVDLQDVGERIRHLKDQREQIEERLAELKQGRMIPLHLFKDDSINEFQETVKELFLGESNRAMTKRYLQLFIEKMVIKLPKVDIIGRSDVVLAVLENKKAVKTDGVLTAVDAWLPSTDSNRGPSG
jgi:hypothetical protein